MRGLSIAVLLLAVTLGPGARAELSADDLPDSSVWYFHLDLGEMRESDAGAGLYAWLQREVFPDIRDETGFDFDPDVDTITGFSTADTDPVVLLEGRITGETRDRVLALAAQNGELDRRRSGGKVYYYFIDRDDDDDDRRDRKIDTDGIYLSFALPDRLLVTPSEQQMRELLASGGAVPGRQSHGNALFVLSAERNFVQAGADAGQLRRDDDGWKSRILRNTRQMALLIADVDGKIAIDTRLQAAEPGMLESIANVVRGLIGLAMFSDETEPNMAAVLRNTRVRVEDDFLEISTVLEAALLVSILED